MADWVYALRPDIPYLMAGLLSALYVSATVRRYSLYTRPDMPPEAHAQLARAVYWGLFALWALLRAS